MSSDTRDMMKELVTALRPVIRDGVEVFDANGQPTGRRKTAPAAYFSVAQKICAAEGMTATDEEANELAEMAAKAMGKPFSPAVVVVEDAELE